jgi:hypothetical protein
MLTLSIILPARGSHRLKGVELVPTLAISVTAAHPDEAFLNFLSWKLRTLMAGEGWMDARHALRDCVTSP